MSRVCFFTGKRTVSGRSIARRGKAKYLGGVGRKVTGVTKRKFKPNIQKVRAVVDGKVCRIKVSAKAIRMGIVQKPPKRNIVCLLVTFFARIPPKNRSEPKRHWPTPRSGMRNSSKYRKYWMIVPVHKIELV